MDQVIKSGKTSKQGSLMCKSSGETGRIREASNRVTVNICPAHFSSNLK